MAAVSDADILLGCDDWRWWALFREDLLVKMQMMLAFCEAMAVLALLFNFVCVADFKIIDSSENVPVQSTFEVFEHPFRLQPVFYQFLLVKSPCWRFKGLQSNLRLQFRNPD